MIAPKTLLLMLATPDLLSLWIRGFPSLVRQIMTRTEGWRTIAQIVGGHPVIPHIRSPDKTEANRFGIDPW